MAMLASDASAIDKGRTENGEHVLSQRQDSEAVNRLHREPQKGTERKQNKITQMDIKKPALKMPVIIRCRKR